jgi:Tfp pilus assembly protein PilF
MSGCATLLDRKAAKYETVRADHRADTETAEKHYRWARRYLEKCARGGRCEYDKAEQRLQQALVADVRYGPAHHSLGLLYFWQKKLYLAAWEFQYAAKLMPDRFEPLNNLGLVYESVGKYEEAATFYLQAQERAPTNPEVVGNLARATIRSGQSVDDARPLLEDVLAVDPRPEWICWAEGLLGVHPYSSGDPPANGPELLPEPIRPGKELSGDEEVQGPELPLIQFDPEFQARRSVSDIDVG